MIESKLLHHRESKEILPVNPTFFICSGTSGAGLTTALKEIVSTGLVNEPPAQFVTRQLRPNETRGEQYFPVNDEILSRIPQQIVLEATLYGNRYGFFKPAIEKLKKTLQKKNIIIDSVNTKKEWVNTLGDYSVISIFFAPKNPLVSLSRMLQRARDTGAVITKGEVATRVSDSANSVSEINGFDYWVDTTHFDSIIPDLTSIITYHSFGSDQKPSAIKVADSEEVIAQFIKAYNIDLTDHISTIFQR